MLYDIYSPVKFIIMRKVLLLIALVFMYSCSNEDSLFEPVVESEMVTDLLVSTYVSDDGYHYRFSSEVQDVELGGNGVPTSSKEIRITTYKALEGTAVNELIILKPVVSSKPSWIREIEFEQVYYGHYALHLTADPNISYSERMGSVILTQPESNQTISLQVTQKAGNRFDFGPGYVTTENLGFTYTGKSLTGVPIVYSGKEIGETFLLGLKPEVTSKPSWVSGVELRQVNYAEYQLFVEVDENSSASKRTGEIVFTQPESNRVIRATVAQYAVVNNNISVSASFIYKNRIEIVATVQSEVRLDVSVFVYYDVYNREQEMKGEFAAIRIPAGQRRASYIQDYNPAPIVSNSGDLTGFRLTSGAVTDSDDFCIYTISGPWR